MNLNSIGKELLDQRNKLIENIDKMITKLNNKLVVSKMMIGDVPSPCYDKNIEFLNYKINNRDNGLVLEQTEKYGSTLNETLVRLSNENYENIIRKVQLQKASVKALDNSNCIENLEYVYNAYQFRNELHTSFLSSEVNQIDTNKGYIHIYQLKKFQKENRYFIGSYNKGRVKKLNEFTGLKKAEALFKQFKEFEKAQLKYIELQVL